MFTLTNCLGRNYDNYAPEIYFVEFYADQFQLNKHRIYFNGEFVTEETAMNVLNRFLAEPLNEEYFMNFREGTVYSEKSFMEIRHILPFKGSLLGAKKDVINLHYNRDTLIVINGCSSDPLSDDN